MCDDREKLIAYLYDEASASERRLADAHLAECAECREELRGLRSVRQDLLSWDVPEHESVWKPFVNPVAAVWWKQVPAWGLAAAATLVFGLGLAGGFAARAMAGAPVVMQAQAPAPAQPQVATPQTVAASPEQVRALEDRLASIERVALTPPSAPRASTVSLTRAELDQLLIDSEGRINKRTADKLYKMMLDIDKQRTRDLITVTQQINEAQQQNASLMGRVITASNRSPEKEKE
ncbi:MAG: zf-HC2 domain-containing protein [Acidobacteriota bacterium]